MSNKVNIANVDKVVLLACLWGGQKAASFFDSAPDWMIPGFDKEAAAAAVRNGHIDYFCNRAVKTDLSGDTVDPVFVRVPPRQLTTLTNHCL